VKNHLNFNVQHHIPCEEQVTHKNTEKLKEQSTFRDNALDADHGANEFRKKFSWCDTARYERAFEPHKNLLSFLQVLGINRFSSVCDRITEGLHVFTWILENPEYQKIN
jgi:hypothetical protein